VAKRPLVDRVAFAAGQKAGTSNANPADNPFRVEPARSSWMNGWRQGQIDRQKTPRTPQPETAP